MQRDTWKSVQLALGWPTKILRIWWQGRGGSWIRPGSDIGGRRNQRFGARWWESSPTKVVFPHIWCFSTTAVWGHGQHGHDGTTAGNDARQQKQTKCMVLNRCVFVCVYPVKVLVFERWPHCWFQFLDGLNPTRGIYYVNLCQAC